MGKLDRQRRLTRGTSGKIVELLRRGAKTIDDLSGALGLSRTAVRAQLATLLQDGSVEPRELRRGPSKPARMYGMTADAESLLSRAYIPILTQLLHVLAGRVPHQEFDVIMRSVGRRLVTGLALPQGTLAARVLAASALLNGFGGVTDVEGENRHFVIRGHGCPIAVATAEYPEACNAIETFLTEYVGQPVAKRCEYYDRKRCCFEVGDGTGSDEAQAS